MYKYNLLVVYVTIYNTSLDTQPVYRLTNKWRLAPALVSVQSSRRYAFSVAFSHLDDMSTSMSHTISVHCHVTSQRDVTSSLSRLRTQTWRHRRRRATDSHVTAVTVSHVTVTMTHGSTLFIYILNTNIKH